MPFEIVRNDIVKMQVDAIVNTANPQPIIGYGVDSGIHQAAGPKLLKARERIGAIPVGGAAITSGFDLDAKYVIHAVGPVWQGGGQNEEALLRQCYDRSLELARRKRCKSIAFPLMSAGNHGFPKPLALQIAIRAISDFLMKQEMQIYLVVFSRDAFQLSEKLFSSVSSFIDENYVLSANKKQYGVSNKCDVRYAEQELILLQQQRSAQVREDYAPAPQQAPCLGEIPDPAAPCPQEFRQEARPAMSRKSRRGFSLPLPSLEELLKKTDAGFSETLLKLIDQTGKKDSEVYKRANVTKQHFSKIRNNRDYKPTKATAVAFAIALELDLEQTKDLIGRAGYALTMSSKFDVIITYFITLKNYDIYEINMTLFEFDQPTLGV